MVAEVECQRIKEEKRNHQGGGGVEIKPKLKLNQNPCLFGHNTTGLKNNLCAEYQEGLSQEREEGRGGKEPRRELW